MSCRARHRTTRHGISFFCLPLPLRASVFMCVCAYRCKNHLFLTQLGLLGSFFNASLFRLMSFLSLSSLYSLYFVQVQDNREGREREETEPYALERIATILAITCMFLSALYFIFAVLLFVTYVSDYNHHNPHGSHQPSTARDDSRSKPRVGMDRQFITMEGSS